LWMGLLEVLVVSGRREVLGMRFGSESRLVVVGVERGGLWLVDELLPFAVLVRA